jgi:RNA polymerase sigma factor (sigma-70 family)
MERTTAPTIEGGTCELSTQGHGRRREEARQQTVTELVELARWQNSSAWEELVRRYDGVVRGTVYRTGLRGAEADDVCQQTWLQLVRALDSLQAPEALPGWLATAARRASLRHLQQRSRYVLVDEMPGLNLRQADLRDGPEFLVEAGERRRAVRRALADLPPAHRALIELIDGERHYSYQDAAAILGVPVGSIGPRRGRCLRAMRALAPIAALASS